ncbi:hypothetical protein RvY_18594 [Ramazzottius varieornatus]|uniref:Fucosyltransferase n=1 Tax=Ramazzottius varieornatus TaxID=947166 RepID=A0A1D1W6C4_RAMVA|nr:hypothetical protein RvY_18594 [Ramazzottius varieornatus]
MDNRQFSFGRLYQGQSQLALAALDNSTGQTESKTALPRQPLILYWTKYYNHDFNSRQQIYQEAVHGLRSCPVNNCVITSNRSMLNQSSAVIFHVRDMQWEKLPAYRDPQQYYVFHLLESPRHTEMSLASLAPGFFNLTFTYRLDSDIVADTYFQNYKPPMWADWSSFEETLRVKTKLAVAFVSNCITPSRRNLVLEELREYIAIDVYGRCGPLKCKPTSLRKEAACDRLVSTYKFYLAFENSVCRDYVTEKVHRAYAQDTVPVILGGANYTALFPPNSFINIWDFPSAKALAEHLLFLSASSAAY